MSITIVQTAHATGAGSSTACSFSVLPAAGNTIIVCHWNRGLSGAYNFSCSDNQSNGYTNDVHAFTSGNASSIWRASNIGSPSGTFTVTVTNNSGDTGITVVILEVSGLINTGQPEVTPVSASAASGSTVAPGNMTTTNNADLIVGVMADNGSISVSPSSPWVSVFKIASTANEVGEAIYQVVSSTGTFNPTWTVSGFEWAACQAAYKAPGNQAAGTATGVATASGAGASTVASAGTATSIATANGASPSAGVIVCPPIRRRWGRRKPPIGTRLLAGHVLSKSLAGGWLLNDGGGTTIRDTSFSKNTGTLVAGTTWGEGLFGPCLVFTGAGNPKVSLSAPVSLGTVYTTAAWIKLTNTTNNQMIVSSSTTDYGVTMGLLPTDGSNRNLYCSDGGSIENYCTYGTWDTNWHHYAFVRVNSDYSFYVDGVLVGTSNRGGTNVAEVPDQIGLYHNYTSFNFNGNLDHLLLFNRALLPSEIQGLASREPFSYMAPPSRIAWAASGTTLVPAAGTADGVATSSGVGSSTAAVTGSATGVAIVSGVGASTATSTGTATGVATASAIGIAIFAGAGAAAGVSSTNGSGASTATIAGSADGLATVTGIGASTFASAGSASGDSSALADGASTTTAAGTADGIAIATGFGASNASSAGSSVGVSTASSVGASTAVSVGTVSGDSTATATGGSQAASLGTADGSASASAIGASLAAAVSSANGIATASGVSSTPGSIGTANGGSSASGVGAALASTSGLIAGLATATAVGTSIAASAGSADGTSLATASGTALIPSAGSSDGSSSAFAIGRVLIPSVGTATAGATASGAGASLVSGAGTASCDSSAAGFGASIVSALGLATANSFTFGLGASLVPSSGTAVGNSLANGVGAYLTPVSLITDPLRRWLEPYRSMSWIEPARGSSWIEPGRSTTIVEPSRNTVWIEPKRTTNAGT